MNMLMLNNNNLNDESIHLILECLINTNVKQLSFSKNELGKKSIETLKHTFINRNGKNVEYLNVNECKIS